MLRRDEVCGRRGILAGEEGHPWGARGRLCGAHLEGQRRAITQKPQVWGPAVGAVVTDRKTFA